VIHKSGKKESILDKVINIPKELVLDIPKLQPLCNEIKELKKGFIDIKNGKLYYEEEGQGASLVLINGGPGGTHHVFHPYFSQIKNFTHIIYYDQRGTGKSSIDDTGRTYTIRQAVEDLESLRKALKINKWAVLGFSYGGLLAQCYALTYPERVTGLILLAAHSGLTEPIIKTKDKYTHMFISKEHMIFSQVELSAIKNITKISCEGRISSEQSIYNKLIAGDWKNNCYYKPNKEELIRKALYEWSPAPGFESIMRQESDKINLKGRFDDFEIPTLVIEAKWDLQWNNPDRAELMRKNHPHAQVKIFEKSGHKIFADEPEKFFILLKDFLKKSSTAKITYKPGNRITWPEAHNQLLRMVIIAQLQSVKSEREKLIDACYKQALSEKSMDPDVWIRIVYDCIHAKKNYDKCLKALRHLESSLKNLNLQTYVYCVQAWKGHMLDLLGRREAAIRFYREALENNNGRSDNYFDGCMKINKQWLEERLKKPFTRDLFKY
jgi:proline iminopeptidase